MAIESVNPATGETLKVYEEMTPQQAAAAVAEAHEAWKAWRKVSFADRVEADEEGRRHSSRAEGGVREADGARDG